MSRVSFLIDESVRLSVVAALHRTEPLIAAPRELSCSFEWNLVAGWGRQSADPSHTTGERRGSLFHVPARRCRSQSVAASNRSASRR